MYDMFEGQVESWGEHNDVTGLEVDDQDVLIKLGGWQYGTKRKRYSLGLSNCDFSPRKKRSPYRPSFTYASSARPAERYRRPITRQPSTTPMDIDVKVVDNAFNYWHKEQEFQPLFEDVSTPFQPPGEGHDQFEQDVEMCDQSLNSETLMLERSRAEDLSYRRICNAPPYDADLPWDEIIENDCTLEELIVFFPNHVLRWPVLALCLRKMEWDRTFERVAWLINTSRGVHHYSRDFRHAEALPCMLKAERAIKELDSTFSFDEWDSKFAQLSPDLKWLRANRFMKPKTFPKMDVPTVSLAEAASWVTCNPFLENTFSQYVYKRWNEEKWEQKKVLQTEHTFFAPKQGHPYRHNDRQNVEAKPPNRDRYNSRNEGWNSDSSDSNDSGTWNKANNRISDDPSYDDVLEGESSIPEPMLCPAGSFQDCDFAFDCPYTHTEDTQKTYERPEKSSRDCRYGTNCTKRGCNFSHPTRGPEIISLPRTQLMNQSSRNQSTPYPRMCRWELDCRRIHNGCRFEHPTPAPTRDEARRNAKGEQYSTRTNYHKQQRCNDSRQITGPKTTFKDGAKRAHTTKEHRSRRHFGSQESRNDYRALDYGEGERSTRERGKGLSDRRGRGGGGHGCRDTPQ